MGNSNLQWHPAFFAALQIDLKDETVPLIVRANRTIMEGDELMCQALREMFADEFLQHETKGRLEGQARGQILHTISQACRKLCKNKSLETIADEIEETLEYTTLLCNIAQKYAPEYDVEQIYQELMET